MTNVITIICSEWMIILSLSQQLKILLSRSTTSSCSQVQSPGEVRKKAASVSFFLQLVLLFICLQCGPSCGLTSLIGKTKPIMCKHHHYCHHLHSPKAILGSAPRKTPSQPSPLQTQKKPPQSPFEMKIKSSITTICICLMLMIRGEERGTSSQRWRRLFFLFFIFL